MALPKGHNENILGYDFCTPGPSQLGLMVDVTQERDLGDADGGSVASKRHFVLGVHLEFIHV